MLQPNDSVGVNSDSTAKPNFTYAHGTPQTNATSPVSLVNNSTSIPPQHSVTLNPQPVAGLASPQNNLMPSNDALGNALVLVFLSIPIVAAVVQNLLSKRTTTKFAIKFGEFQMSYHTESSKQEESTKALKH